jgi:hypothetical protein
MVGMSSMCFGQQAACKLIEPAGLRDLVRIFCNLRTQHQASGARSVALLLLLLLLLLSYSLFAVTACRYRRTNCRSISCLTCRKS